MPVPAEANPQAGTERSLPLPPAPSPLGRLLQTIDVNLLMKYSLVLDIFLSKIEIYESNIHHHKMNTNKSINRKIAIILTAKFNRIMLKEIFAGKLDARL